MVLTSPEQKVPETLILTTSVYIVDEPVSPLGDLDCSRYPINLTEATSKSHYIQAEWTPPGGSWITFTGEPSTVGTIKAHPLTGPPDFTVWYGTVRYGIVSYHIISYHISYHTRSHDMIWQDIPVFGNFMTWNWCLTFWFHWYPDQPSTTTVHSITSLWIFGSNVLSLRMYVSL